MVESLIKLASIYCLFLMFVKVMADIRDRQDQNKL